MSFLLLKSKSRSSRSTSYRSRQPSKQQSNGNPNNNDRNPSIAMRSHHQSTSSNSRRFANMKEIHAGDGQVQLQRPRQVVQEQSRQSNVQSHKQQQQQQQQQQKQVQQQVHRSIQQNQQQNQQQQNDNIISMDEGKFNQFLLLLSIGRKLIRILISSIASVEIHTNYEY